jgi:asparagine synthase (glutamine-hydrolysing)
MFEPHFLAGDDLDPVGECLRQLIFYEDGAFYAPNLFLHWAMYEQAAASGVKVFLDGIDGDSTLSHGIHYPHELLSGGHPLRAWAEVRALAARQGQSPLAVARMMGLQTGLRRRARRLLARGVIRNRAYRGQFGILSGEFAQRMNAQRSGRSERPPLGFFSTEREAHHRQVSWPLHTVFLETADRAAAPHGIEPRYPFYDVELTEFCLAMPGHQKLRAGWTRWVMRRAMEGLLPSAVQWRPGKSDLHSVLQRGLSRCGASQVEQLLSQPERIAGYVDLDVVRRKWRSFDDAPSQDVMAIWLPLVLDEALRAGSDGRAAASARVAG